MIYLHLHTGDAEWNEAEHPRDENGQWTGVGTTVKHREHLPGSDTKETKYIRFGDIPKSGHSTMGRAPNIGYWGREGEELAGVSVFKVKFNKKRNLWQIDTRSEGLADSGLASLDELIADQSEYDYDEKKRSHQRPIYLLTGRRVRGEEGIGTDGEPLLHAHTIKKIDKLNVQDLLHEGYFDPDQDLYPEYNPSAFHKTGESP